MKYIDDNPELAEEANKDDGIKNFHKFSSDQPEEEEEEDWQEFNKRNQKDQKHGSRKKK